MSVEMAEMAERLMATPAVVVILNHCIAIHELAVLHLDQESPNLGEAKVAIDALAAMVERLGTRFGENERPLREALSQLQLAFVEASRPTG